jgi:hypothetical protein
LVRRSGAPVEAALVQADWDVSAATVRRDRGFERSPPIAAILRRNSHHSRRFHGNGSAALAAPLVENAQSYS